MSEDDTRFDGLFMSVLQQKQNIGGFFESIFGFLRRQSDFFADQKRAEEVMVTECKKQFDQYVVDKQRKEQEERVKQEKEAAKKKAKEEQERLAREQEQQKQAQLVQTQEQLKQTNQEKVEGEKKNEDDEKPPVGNGGRTDHYIWTQTLDELQVYIPIPSNIKSRDLNVKITTDKLLVQIKGQNPIIDGELYEKIHSDGSVWTITDGEIQDYKGKYIHVAIEKWNNQMHWWDCVIKGDPKINTQKINPEPSKLNDLDGETRGTVEKMMFDMRQKQMGLPSSEELEKKKKLEEFMKGHPEMDFSKCKFN